MTTPHDTTTTAPAPLYPGQAAAPPGPCDLTGMYLMHHGFRRDLDRLARAAAATPYDERRTWRAIAAWWRDVAALLAEHHTKEDELLWPVLLERVDDAGRRVLDAMEAEHHLLDPALEAVAGALRDLTGAGPTPAARDRAVSALTEVRELLDTHLAHEERDAVALVQAHLGGAEWRRLEADGLAARPAPPLLLFLLPWVADGLTRDDLAPLMDAAGAPMAVLLRLAAPRYRRRARRAFAHLDERVAA